MTPLEVIRDAAARLARVLEALADGDTEFAFEIGGGLEHDLHRSLKTFEVPDPPVRRRAP